MLQFHSASVRIANTERAVDECLEIAYEGATPSSIGAVIVNAAMGHKLDRVADAIHKTQPGAIVLGSSCGGIIGREGAGEAMTHMAMMMVDGPAEEIAYAAAEDVHSENSHEKALAAARDLKAKLPGTSIIYLLCAGIDANAEDVLAAFVEVFGEEVVIFGGTASDNYKGITTMQYIGTQVTEHGIWALGMADSTLKAASKANHGFVPYGEPMVVTKAEENRILEIDGLPAWAAYMARLSIIPEDDPALSVITTGGMSQKLPEHLAAEYGSTHILRGAAMDPKREGVMAMSVNVAEGDEFWLTLRDEARIFSEQEKALTYLQSALDGHEPVAVFQTDCLARGRTLFNRVMKDELIGMMQTALSAGGEVPPWLGMYGFGEFCLLGGQNTFHTYTTSLMVLYR